MVLDMPTVRHTRARIRLRDAGAVVYSEVGLGTNVGGSNRANYPNGHIAADIAPMIVHFVGSQTGGFPNAHVACAIVEDATDTGGVYADASDNPRTDLGVVAFAQLGPFSGLVGAGTTWSMSIGTKFGTMRIVAIFGDSPESCRSVANVNTGATNQFHFDSDGNAARGSLAGPALADSREAGHMGRRAVVAGLDVDLATQTYPRQPTVTLNLDAAGGGGEGGVINPKEVKVAVRYNASAPPTFAGLRPKGVFRKTPSAANGTTSQQYNVDTLFTATLTPLDLVVGNNASLGDAATPNGEKPALFLLPVTIQGLTAAQLGWVYIHETGHAPGLTFEPAAGTVARLNAAQVGSRIEVRKTSPTSAAGVVAYLSAAAREAQAPAETRFKRKSPTGSEANARPFLETWVVDAAGNPIASTSFDVFVLRTPFGVIENTQTVVSGSGPTAGRLRWDYAIGSTDAAGNKFRKTNPDPPDTYRQKDVAVTGKAFGVQDPSATASQVFGVNSEIQFAGMWTGDSGEATTDANGAPTGFAKRAKNLSSGQLKYKVCSAINEATGALLDVGAHNPRDAAARAIDVSGAEGLFGARGVWNVTAASIEDAVAEIAAGNASHALDAPLGYTNGAGGDKGFEGKDTSGDSRTLALYMAYADTRTQAQSFALGTDLTDVGFAADVGNYGYIRQEVQFVALDADFVIVAAPDDAQHPAGASPVITAKVGKYLRDGTFVERKPDAPPVIHISRHTGLNQALAVVAATMTAVNPDAEGKSADWQYTFAAPERGTYGVTISCLIGGTRPTGPGRTVLKVGVPDPDLELLSLATHAPGGAHARHVEAGDALHVVAFAKRRSTGLLVDLDAAPTAPACVLLRPSATGGLEHWDGAAWHDLGTDGPATLFPLAQVAGEKTWARTFAPSPLLDPRDVIVVVYARIAGVPYSTREGREVVGALVNRHDGYAFDPIGFVTGLPTR